MGDAGELDRYLPKHVLHIREIGLFVGVIFRGKANARLDERPCHCSFSGR
jgi:hypothetical protein